MNATLLLVDVVAIALGIAAWLSPDFLDRQSRHFKARAAALRKSRAVYKKTFEGAMGLPTSPPAVYMLPQLPPALRSWKAPSLKKLGSFLTSIAVFAGVLVIGFSIVALVVMPQ